MNAPELELLRTALLQTLREASPYPVPMATLILGAKLGGVRDADAKLVGAELAYLADKMLVAPLEKLVSPENAEWRLTAHGRDYLATRGL